jgi:hypothetical protein
MSIKIDSEDIKIFYDYLGNIFLNYENSYYYFDITDELELLKINNIDLYKKYLEDNNHIKNTTKGEIFQSKQTLKGTTNDYIKGNDEITDNSIDHKYYESKFYHMKYDKIEEDHFMNLNDDDSYINCDSLTLCNFAFLNPPSYDMIYMEDNIVLATVENKTGFCTKRITIHSNNKIRLYFVGDKDYFYKIKIINNTLCIEKDS